MVPKKDRHNETKISVSKMSVSKMCPVSRTSDTKNAAVRMVCASEFKCCGPAAETALL